VLKTFEGALESRVMTIGGETTGVVLKTKSGERYELDFGDDGNLANLAEKLSGKPVVVTGENTIRGGVETKDRRIIRVAKLVEATRP